MARRAYALLECLTGSCGEDDYRRWLKNTAGRQLRRDRKRGNKTATGKEYKMAIHAAVARSQGRDFYTGLPLSWELICQYNNSESAKHRREYKKKFGDLPTVDHCGDGLGPADFAICSWRVNDCKNDLTLREFLEVCQQVVRHNATPGPALPAVSKEHIEITPGICGGRARIAGHRIRIQDVVICHEQQNMSVDEIASAYPGITLADVHAALAYYFDNQEEIQRDIQEERRFVEEVMRDTPSRLNEKD